ncbi:MAG: hypothetical protein LQ351_002522 [Letrouitia transgressa]|nr:MAG: hypothetical protein LQ351_002522 [Letrouitia transgressa]
MNGFYPLRCIFAKTLPPSKTAVRRSLHTSKSLRARPSPKFKSIKASDLGIVKKDKSRPRITAENFPAYTQSEKAELAKRYTPDQLAAIEAGEAAVDPQDLVDQGAIRNDPMKIEYLDDLSEIHPVVDKPVRAPEKNYDPNLRFKSEDELTEDLAKWVINDLPDDPTRLDWMKFLDKTRLTVGKEEAELNPRSYLAPDLPKLEVLQPPTEDDEEIDPATRRLMRQTGFTHKEIQKFNPKILIDHRVVNQTRLGKIQSQYYLAVAGNGKGLLGIGEGKSGEREDAMRQAKNKAIRNMQPIPMYEQRTIFGDVKGKVSGTAVELRTRPPGFGIRCQSLIYEMCRAAGLEDLSAKVTRSRNKMNTVKATLQALLSQRLPEDEARGRGRKLVDVRKVYYNGNT